MISFHSLYVDPKQDYLHSIHLHSFPFVYFKTSNQSYLISFHSILFLNFIPFYSFSLLKYILFHSFILTRAICQYSILDSIFIYLLYLNIIFSLSLQSTILNSFWPTHHRNTQSHLTWPHKHPPLHHKYSYFS